MAAQFNPVAKLLDRDEYKERTLRELGSAMVTLEASVTNYKQAHKAAVEAGWTKKELTGAGFVEAIRLPKIKKIDTQVADDSYSQGE